MPNANIKDYLRESRQQEIKKTMSNILENLKNEGLFVEFGRIGLRVTYAMIYSEDHSIEIVGYTFLKNARYYDENLGKLKALQQAIARKNTTEEGRK